MIDPLIRDFRIDPYELGLSQVWRSARGRIGQREGEILRLEDEAGGIGIGECAPLPEAGTEDPDAARRWLRERTRTLLGQAVEAGLADVGFSDAVSAVQPTHPAARCAIETALLDLKASRAGVPLRSLLASDAGDEFAVNASLGALDASIRDRARTAFSAGFQVLKIKLGVGAPAAEQAALAELAAGLPASCRLRLDANGAWDEEGARGWLAVLRDLPVDCLEEPLRDAAPEQLRALQSACEFPLAADESLQSLLISSGPDRLPVRRAVLKPTVLGGAQRTLQLATTLMQHGIECVVTTALEAAPGRWLVAQCAAALGNDLSHGLDTGSWLESDLGPGPPVLAGRCRLPRSPGLGFDPAQLPGQ